MSDSKNYVRRMAEYFEKLSQDLKVSSSGHEIRFKHWWLDSLISEKYFDDRMSNAHSSRFNTKFDSLGIETVRLLSTELKKPGNRVHRKY